MVIAVITSTESQAILFALLVAMFAHFLILHQNSFTSLVSARSCFFAKHLHNATRRGW